MSRARSGGEIRMVRSASHAPSKSRRERHGAAHSVADLMAGAPLFLSQRVQEPQLARVRVKTAEPLLTARDGSGRRDYAASLLRTRVRSSKASRSASDWQDASS